MHIDIKGKFDSEVCENIPLNFTNLIQGYGYLLVTDYNLKILQWSENFLVLLKLTNTDFEGRNFKDFLSVTQYEEVRKKIENKNVEDHISIDLDIVLKQHFTRFRATLHIKDKYVLFELEESNNDNTLSFTKLYQEIEYFSAVLKVAGSMEEICQKAAENLMSLSSFDRVMIYRFDEDWNGQVLGEASVNGKQEYLGFHFPSSDIPRQARQLYLKNPYRMIPDINDKDQQLIPPINKSINGITDLSDCNLRSVASVHLEYLKKMGVQASMSVPIVKDQQLWGIIACHHNTPKHLSYELRTVFGLLSNLISELVTTRESHYLLTKRIELFDKLGEMTRFMSYTGDFVSGLSDGKVNILQLLNLTGAVILYENTYNRIGATPPKKFVEEMMEWYKNAHPQQFFFSHELANIFPPAQEYSNLASGVIFLPLSGDHKYYIIGFRKEYVQTIKWAGDPGYASGLPNDLAALHPRNSFGLYIEKKRHNSLKWTNIEIEIAHNLLKSILEIILRSQILKRIIAEEEVYKLSIIAQRTGNAVLTLNQHGRVEWVNQSFSDYSGMQLKDVTGKTFAEILKSSENIIIVTDSKSKGNVKRSAFKTDILLHREDKGTYLNFNVSRVKNIDKQKYKYIIIGTDVTKMKEKSNVLASINEQLDDYTNLVAHDLKAPIKGIEGLINVLEENTDFVKHEENTEVFSLIRESISKMDLFISSLLSQAKQHRIELSEVDLNILLEDVFKWLNPDKSRIKYSLEKNMPVIQTNKNTLQQVFSNLISNAIRYGCNKEGICEIEIGISEMHDTFIQFFVKDNGYGISKEYHQRIFNLYDTGKENNSTGIGLHTTKSLIEKNNGRIWVESEPGHGALFKFEWTI
ncbi:MAG: GAF domain-containing protein [Opitutaceae bacterium]|nr:GAF domain-containing protein [Cytophagales bacterium]